MNWINVLGLIIVLFMLIPNIVYAYKNKNTVNLCDHKIMNIIEQIGRYSSMFLMVFNIGILEFGFASNELFVLWIIGIVVLLFLYWLFWYFYFKSPRLFFALMLAIIPSCIFIFTGLSMRHWLLVIVGILFSVGHIYVTYQNNSTKTV